MVFVSSTENRGEFIFTAIGTTAQFNFASSYMATLYLDDIRLDRIDNKQVQIVSLKDYYPFGAVMKGRSYTASGGKYRYGFNGKEFDEETDTQDYGFRMFDNGVARFFSVDPYHNQYPSLTPYQFAHNSPIQNVDLDGLEKVDYKRVFLGTEQTVKIQLNTAWANSLAPKQIVSMNQMDYEVVSVQIIQSNESFFKGTDGEFHHVKIKGSYDPTVSYWLDELNISEEQKKELEYHPDLKTNMYGRRYIDGQLTPKSWVEIVLTEVNYEVFHLEDTYTSPTTYFFNNWAFNGGVFSPTFIGRTLKFLNSDPNNKVMIESGNSPNGRDKTPDVANNKKTWDKVERERRVRQMLTSQGVSDSKIAKKFPNTNIGIQVRWLQKTVAWVSKGHTRSDGKTKKIIPNTGTPSEKKWK